LERGEDDSQRVCIGDIRRSLFRLNIEDEDEAEAGLNNQTQTANVVLLQSD
jgi:hypothetical protein